MKSTNQKYYLVYQIENKLNGMIYIGCHVTTNPKDKYMGSGTNIRKAIKEYGLDNFEKSILYCFDNEKEMLDKEAELVNRQFISNPNTYNISIGGGSLLTLDTIPVKDKDGNMFRVHKTDPRYLSGELVHNTKGMVTVKDQNNNTFNVSIDDARYLSGELVGSTTGKVSVKDKEGNKMQVSKDDPQYLSGELVFITAGFVNVKDKDGNRMQVSVTDPRYLSGELKHTWKDRKHSDETKKKMSESSKGKGTGANNSQFGTCWISNDIENKKIKKEELDQYLNNGWSKGRKIKKR